jgi:hypothetical protein
MSNAAIDPDASAYDLMAIYGALMQLVQTYELLLASLALVVEVDPARISNASLKRQLKAAVRKGVHVFQNGSPAASRDRLEGKIPGDLHSELADLVPHRNRLAHSFLVQQIVDGEAGPRFRPGTALEIVKYAQRFTVINRRLQEELTSRATSLTSAPEEIQPLIDKLARSIVLGKPLAGPKAPKPR